MPMPCLALGQDSTGGDIERGEQGGGAMANVVVGDSFDMSGSNGQHGLGPVQGLYLTSFHRRRARSHGQEGSDRAPRHRGLFPRRTDHLIL